MFDIGWSELLIIAVIAIIVVGPRDLPRMMRTVGQYVSKLRSMGRDLQRQFDAAVREADLDDVRKSMTDVGRMNPMRDIREAVTKPLKSVSDDLKRTAGEVERSGSAAKPPASDAEAPPVSAPANDEPRIEAPEAPAAAEPASAAPAPVAEAEPKRAATGT